MGNPAGVRRDFDALEKRRFQALSLLDEGLSQSDVARRVKVARQTVVRWLTQYKRRGREGLRKAGRAGRRARLGASQLERLEGLLLRGPEALGYDAPLWTCRRVAHLIEEKFGIRYHQGHVWKILVGLGWSPQGPAGLAQERNQQAVRTWKRSTQRATESPADRGSIDPTP